MNEELKYGECCFVLSRYKLKNHPLQYVTPWCVVVGIFVENNDKCCCVHLRRAQLISQLSSEDRADMELGREVRGMENLSGIVRCQSDLQGDWSKVVYCECDNCFETEGGWHDNPLDALREARERREKP